MNQEMYWQFVTVIIPEAVISAFFIGAIVGVASATLIININNRNKEEKNDSDSRL